MSTRPKKRNDRSPHARARERRSRIPNPAEVLGPLDRPEDAAVRSYERTFEAVLREEVEKSRDPILAFSRAASSTWDVSFLPPHDAEAARLRVLDRSGLPRMRGGWQARTHADHDGDDLDVPHAPARSDRVRRGGSRR